MRNVQTPVGVFVEPSLTSGYPLNDGPQWISVIIPEATRNIITNPSFELDTTGWTASSDGSAGTPFARLTGTSYKGASCAQLTIQPTAGTFVQVVDAVTLVSAAVWTASFHVKRVGSDLTLHDVRLSVAGVLSPFTYLEYCDDGWYRVSATFASPSTGSVSIGIRVLGTPGSIYYLDACQLENKQYVTTYCDGDQNTYTSARENEFVWEGFYHQSISNRTSLCRSGGRVVNLDEYGFRILAVQGLGLGPITNRIENSASLDGGQFQDARISLRSFTVAGRVYGSSHAEVRRKVKLLEAAFAPLTARRDEQLMLVFQVRDSDSYTSSKLLVPCVYAGGLDGNISGLYGDEFSIQFLQPTPYLFADRDVGDVIIAGPDISGVMVVRKTANSPWTTLATGTGKVTRMLKGKDGFFYVCGTFTSINGVTANNVARYSDDTGWLPLLNGVNNGVNGGCTDICMFPGGNIIIVGAFTTAGGAAATNVALYSVASNVLFPVTGITGGAVTTCCPYAGGFSIMLGGTFTSPSIAICKIGANGIVSAEPNFGFGTVKSVRGSILLGSFILNTLGVLYSTNTFTYTQIGTGLPSSRIQVGSDGFLYAVGNTSIGSVPVNEVGKWTGSKWVDAGVGVFGLFAGTPDDLEVNLEGGLTGIGNYTDNYIGARQSGNMWRPLDIRRTGSGALSYASDKTYEYVGFDGTLPTSRSGEFKTFNLDSSEGGFLVFYMSSTVSSIGGALIHGIRVADDRNMQFNQLPFSIYPEPTIVTLLPNKVTVRSPSLGDLFNMVRSESDVVSVKAPKGSFNVMVLTDDTGFLEITRIVIVRAYQSISEVMR